MAISIFKSTTREMTLYVPNMVEPTNSVNLWSGFTLVTWREIRPNIDQNNDCSVWNSLKSKQQYIKQCAAEKLTDTLIFVRITFI